MGPQNPPETFQNHTMTDTAPPPFVFHQGTAPLLISMPHAGTHVPVSYTHLTLPTIHLV